MSWSRLISGLPKCWCWFPLWPICVNVISEPTGYCSTMTQCVNWLLKWNTLVVVQLQLTSKVAHSVTEALKWEIPQVPPKFKNVKCLFKEWCLIQQSSWSRTRKYRCITATFYNQWKKTWIICHLHISEMWMFAAIRLIWIQYQVLLPGFATPTVWWLGICLWRRGGWTSDEQLMKSFSWLRSSSSRQRHHLTLSYSYRKVRLNKSIHDRPIRFCYYYFNIFNISEI